MKDSCLSFFISGLKWAPIQKTSRLSGVRSGLIGVITVIAVALPSTLAISAPNLFARADDGKGALEVGRRAGDYPQGFVFAPPVNRLITELSRLPGIGQRTA